MERPLENVLKSYPRPVTLYSKNAERKLPAPFTLPPSDFLEVLTNEKALFIDEKALNHNLYEWYPQMKKLFKSNGLQDIVERGVNYVREEKQKSLNNPNKKINEAVLAQKDSLAKMFISLSVKNNLVKEVHKTSNANQAWNMLLEKCKEMEKLRTLDLSKEIIQRVNLNINNEKELMDSSIELKNILYKRQKTHFLLNLIGYETNERAQVLLFLSLAPDYLVNKVYKSDLELSNISWNNIRILFHLEE